MLTVYGNPMSTCTRKVLMTLAETNTPFEMKVVDLMGGAHKQDTHLHRQPFGRIPAIEDGGFELFESRAICRYINEKVGGKLVPSDLKGRAKMEQWISIETSEFSAHAMKFVYEHIFKRPQEPAVLEAARQAIETTCGVMEKQLHDRRRSSPGATSRSRTSVSFMPYIEYSIGTPLKDTYAKFPHVMTWWNKINSERPAWRKATGKA